MSVPTRNWAGNQRCVPSETLTAASTDQVADAVTLAAERGNTVKAIGAGHSFTDAAMTPGTLVSLDGMNRVLAVDGYDVTVQAGIRLRQLNEELAERGLALANLGDINVQSIAGATSTATHGTGAAFGNLSTMITDLTLVAGDGRVVRCSAQERPDLFEAARVGIGALGIVTEMTLRCVPAFNLHAVETIEPLADVLASFDEVMRSTDHVEFYVMPGARRCQVKRNTRTDDTARPQGRIGYVRDKWIAENLAFGTVCRVGRRFPSLAPRVAKLVAGAAGERDLIDRSDRIFCSPRRVHFLEMEYEIPLAAVPEALDRVLALIKTLPFPPLFPIEVRASRGDDIALSTASGRDSGWIAVHQYVGAPYEAYFQGVERIMDTYEGRPHWGKLHYQNHTTLQPRYPKWDAFVAARAELDPAGTFANPYLDRVLGPR